MTDLLPTNLDGSISAATLKEMAGLIDDAIEDYSIASLTDEPRTHLGISEIGKPCMRQTYYKFRWMAFEQFGGRMRRLFNRGHREEARFIGYLEAIGFKVFQHDENGEQFRCTGVLGHYGGSCDGVAYPPWFPTIPFLLEFKTHNQNSFNKYLDKGLGKHKPEHYDQMCGYGYKMNIHYGLYFPENKNDDDIQVTAIKLDHQRGAQLERKAEEIILAKQPPPKISENPAYQECKFCHFSKICHEGATPVKNCRSCRQAEARDNAEWFCNRWNAIIPSEHIKSGCDEWWPI